VCTVLYVCVCVCVCDLQYCVLKTQQETMSGNGCKGLVMGETILLAQMPRELSKKCQKSANAEVKGGEEGGEETSALKPK
jgi:hypothetical protein